MPASVAMPAVRQNRSKLAPTCYQASSTIAAGTTPAGVVDSFMALLSFVDSAPRAYRLKAGNAYLTFSTSTGTSPEQPPYPQEEHGGRGPQKFSRIGYKIGRSRWVSARLTGQSDRATRKPP